MLFHYYKNRFLRHTFHWQFVLIFLLSTLFTYSQTNTKDSILQKLNNEINRLNHSKSFAHAQWSISVKDCKDGKQITGLNSSMSLMPASALKALTCAAAIEILGNDFRFETNLEYNGVIDSAKTLHGNLYIRGGGDPTFGSKRFGVNSFYKNIFDTWLVALQKAGIKKIDGKIISDASIFDDEAIADGWLWEDIANAYGAGAHGLTFIENSYQIYFDPAKNIGEKATILRTEPELKELKLNNNVTTAGSKSGDQTVIYNSTQANERIINGTIPLANFNFSVGGALTHPDTLCVYLFKTFLNENNIIINTVSNDSLKNNSKRIVIATHLSPRLESIVRETLLYSINTYAEDILKYLGYYKYHMGDRTHGIQAVEAFLKSKNVNTEGFIMKDGCGLSRKDLITTNQFTDMLYKISKEKYFNTFYASLPEIVYADKSNPQKKIIVKAKSGSMEKVRSYAGYVMNKNNQLLSFTIIINNYDADKFIIRNELKKLIFMLTEL